MDVKYIERRAHGECPEHSGMVTKLNIHLAIGGVGLLLLSILLSLVVDTNSYVKVNTDRINKLEATVGKHGDRIASLEIRHGTVHEEKGD